MTGKELAAIQQLALTYQRQYSGRRAGQALFNACYSLCPEAAEAVRGTEVDPFYDDERIGLFFEHLAAFC